MRTAQLTLELEQVKIKLRASEAKRAASESQLRVASDALEALQQTSTQQVSLRATPYMLVFVQISISLQWCGTQLQPPLAELG